MQARPWSSDVQTSGQICTASLAQVRASCWRASAMTGCGAATDGAAGASQIAIERAMRRGLIRSPFHRAACNARAAVYLARDRERGDTERCHDCRCDIRHHYNPAAPDAHHRRSRARQAVKRFALSPPKRTRRSPSTDIQAKNGALNCPNAPRSGTDRWRPLALPVCRFPLQKVRRNCEAAVNMIARWPKQAMPNSSSPQAGKRLSTNARSWRNRAFGSRAALDEDAPLFLTSDQRMSVWAE